MGKKESLALVLSLVVIAAVAVALGYVVFGDGQETAGGCRVKTTTLADGRKAKWGWYACHPVERGDFVLYRMSADHPPVVRSVAAISGDVFKLRRSAGDAAWMIEINGQLEMKDGLPFVFGSGAPHPLSLYENSHQGKLDETSVVLFGGGPDGADSAALGVINVSDLVAKVE